MPARPHRLETAVAHGLPDTATGSWSGGLPNPVASWADSILLSPRINHLIDFRLVIRVKLAEFAEEGLLQDCVSGFLTFIQQIVGSDLEGLSNPGQFFCRRLSCVAVFQFPNVALARVGQFRELIEGVSLLLAMALDLGAEGRGHSIILVFLGCRKLVRYAEQNRSAQVDLAVCSVYIEHYRIALRRFPHPPRQKGLPMTAIASFLRKTPVTRLHDYFTGSGFTSLPPVDWTKPEAELVEPLIKAVDDMDDREKQRVVMNASQVAALADEPGQNALQNVVINRQVFDTLEGANNRSLWVFLNEPDQFRKAEEVRYNDERRRGRSWSGFEVEKDRVVRRDAASVADFTKAIRERFDTPHVHVDVFDRHRVILDDQECDLVQVAVYREGRPEDMLGFDANSTLSRRIVKPVFEAALTYEADTGVIEVVANTVADRRDLTAYMARDLLGIDFEEKHIPLREYDLGMLVEAL